jgi:hypothetical protein
LRARGAGWILQGALRRIAFGGLVLIGVAVAAGLVLWLAVLNVHEDHASRAATVTARLAAAVTPRHPASTVTRHAPTVTAAGGSTCFVGGRECSETPCTEMIGSAMTATIVSKATKVAPSVSVPRLETPVSGCGTHRAPAHATVVNQVPRKGVPATNPYARTLKSLRAQLSRRFP